jgi:acyl-CoA synthetase (NDP forming)
LRTVIEEAIQQGRTALTEIESKQIIRDLGIPTTDMRLATSAEGAARLAAEIGFPVVLKITSPDILHKSDAGGVKVDLNNSAQVREAYAAILTSCRAKFPNADIQGISVQKMAPRGLEIIIGVSFDPQFGPVIMFGLGGIWVEVMKDVSFRLVPVTRFDASRMIREIKGFRLLTGYRGQDPVDIDSLEGILLKVSDFVQKNSRVRELDLNPIFAYRQGAMVVDARIILAKP